jgi:hypothetical protein
MLAKRIVWEIAAAAVITIAMLSTILMAEKSGRSASEEVPAINSALPQVEWTSDKADHRQLRDE